jgi:predicted DNA-binding transcriptional regulator AlpA
MSKKTFFLRADEIAQMVGGTERQVRDKLMKQDGAPKPLPRCKPLRWPAQAVYKFLKIDHVEAQR